MFETIYFFHSLNYKCPVGFNAAEYYVTLLGIEIDKEMESRERIRRICNEYQRSDIAAAIESRVGDVKDEIEYFNGTTDEKVNFSALFFGQYRSLDKYGHNIDHTQDHVTYCSDK